jgi:hypothetical protein
MPFLLQLKTLVQRSKQSLLVDIKLYLFYEESFLLVIQLKILIFSIRHLLRKKNTNKMGTVFKYFKLYIKIKVYSYSFLDLFTNSKIRLYFCQILNLKHIQFQIIKRERTVNL